jgi:hypothetical protein
MIAKGNALGTMANGIFQALKGRNNVRTPRVFRLRWNSEAIRARTQGQPRAARACFALSGLGSVVDVIPRALPWAIMFQPFRLKLSERQ